METQKVFRLLGSRIRLMKPTFPVVLKANDALTRRHFFASALIFNRSQSIV